MKLALLVLSGPSGCGKSSLVNEVLKENDDIYFSISTTTRNPREGEKEGKDYYYISKEQFQKEIAEGLFLEWAEVHGNYYGTSIKPIEDALKNGKLVIFDIDVQGHKIVKKRYASIMTSLFITTPNQNILKERLINRATDKIETIENRLINAKSEMARIGEYDYLLVNDDFKLSLESFESIVKVARLKQTKEKIEQFRVGW
ncbi:MAG TPA: guanylate kinase [Campylobacterales bacterium]|nr:guanylate kinase [Campylobacterales bacterium]HIP60085.1 guanylate kinase [Campylobacterales bacterium]